MFNVHGVLPAMITPIREDGHVNEQALRNLIEYEITNGVHGIFAIGTTGEFYALTKAQYRDTLDIAVDQVKGRVPVYAGANAISTSECIEYTKLARDAGVQAVSVLTPFFISLNQQELYEHFKKVAESTDLPVIVYDNAPRTHITIKPATCSKLADIDNIVAIKDSTGDMTNTMEILRLTKNKQFNVMMGRDSLIYPALAVGATGAVAASANVVPALCAEIYEKYMSGDLQGALEAQMRLVPLRIAFSLGSFPAVIKEALNMIGVFVGDCISPTGKLNEQERAQLKTILTDLDLLK